MYARVIENELQYGLPYTGILLDGRTVSNYNLLPDDVLAAEGWLPVIENMPVYDEATQTIIYDGYNVLVDKIVLNYKVEEIENTIV